MKLADLDIQQGTSNAWHMLRLENGFEAVGSVEVMKTASRAISEARKSAVDLLVIDSPPRASSGTLEIAQSADLVILPSCASRDDLVPAIKLAYELENKGVSKKNIAFALVRVTTEPEIREAREALLESGFNVLEGCLYEKPAYRQAQNEGLAVTETRYKTLNDKANELLESIFNHLINNR